MRWRTVQQWPQDRVTMLGGMKPVSPRVRSATRPLGRITRWVMLPLFRDKRSQPSGGNCNALGREEWQLSTTEAQPFGVGSWEAKSKLPGLACDLAA